MQENINKYKIYSEKFQDPCYEANELNKDKDKQELIELAKTNEYITQHKAFVCVRFLDHKLYEAFLEAGPQSIFQLMIVLQSGFMDEFQLFTILTSILSFIPTATEMYLEYPTKVKKSSFIIPFPP